jgi:hypothetical protein
MPVISAIQEAEIVGLWLEVSPGKVGETLSQKQNERVENMAQVLKCLHSMYKALGSILSTTKIE